MEEPDWMQNDAGGDGDPVDDPPPAVGAAPQPGALPLAHLPPTVWAALGLLSPAKVQMPHGYSVDVPAENLDAGVLREELSDGAMSADELERFMAAQRSPPHSTSATYPNQPEGVYVVSNFLARRTSGGVRELLTSWDGYSHDGNSWEAEADVKSWLKGSFKGEVEAMEQSSRPAHRVYKASGRAVKRSKPAPTASSILATVLVQQRMAEARQRYHSLVALVKGALPNATAKLPMQSRGVRALDLGLASPDIWRHAFPTLGIGKFHIAAWGTVFIIIAHVIFFLRVPSLS